MSKTEWWQTLFDEYYLITDARSLFDKQATSNEVKGLLRAFNANSIGKTSRILDLCGGFGRHSIELNKQGFKNITVGDYSEFLLNYGKKLSKEEGMNNLEYIWTDATELENTFELESFDVVMVLGNSFGYCASKENNKKIISGISKILKKGGLLLMDLSNKEYFDNQPSFKKDWFEIKSKYIICRTKATKLDQDFTNILGRELLIDKEKGQIRDEEYSETLFSKSWFEEKIPQFNLKTLDWVEDWVEYEEKKEAPSKDMGFLSSRILLIAKKNE